MAWKLGFQLELVSIFLLPSPGRTVCTLLSSLCVHGHLWTLIQCFDCQGTKLPEGIKKYSSEGIYLV